MHCGSMQRRKECDSKESDMGKSRMRGGYGEWKFFVMFVYFVSMRALGGGEWGCVMMDPFACIQTLWLKTKSIAWVMSVTGLGKVVSD